MACYAISNYFRHYDRITPCSIQGLLLHLPLPAVRISCGAVSRNVIIHDPGRYGPEIAYYVQELSSGDAAQTLLAFLPGPDKCKIDNSFIQSINTAKSSGNFRCFERFHRKGIIRVALDTVRRIER